MKLRYLMTTLLLCGPALVAAADNTGWQDARTPSATTAAAPQGAEAQTTGVPATRISGELPPRNKARRW
jgi:intracellular multiplication protein IcmK